MIYLLPSYLGEHSSPALFSSYEKELIINIKHYIVENEKSARRFLRFIYPEINQQSLQFRELNKHMSLEEFEDIKKFILENERIGLISEAGLPCIADPGNRVVFWAQEKNIKVIPVSGPSSIFLALMASGFNGQSFTFNGYLPIDKTERARKLKQLEIIANRDNITQIFMETPFRNQALFEDCKNILNPNTYLCIATNITLDQENIKTKNIKDWKSTNVNLHKQPTIFLIGTSA